MSMRSCIILMVILLACVLTASVCQGQVMPPSGGGISIYEGARSVYNRDGDLDTNIINLTTRMRKGTITYQEAETKLYNYYQTSIKRKSYWEDNFSPSQNYNLYHAVDKMLTLQVQRCWELLDATKYERQFGINEAKAKWNAEINTYNQYKSAVKRVGNLL